MKLLIATQKVDMDDDNLGFFHDWIKEFSLRTEKVIVVCLFKGRYDLPQNVKVISLGKEKMTEGGGIFLKLYRRFMLIPRFYKAIWQTRGDYDMVFVHMLPEYVVMGGLLWKMWRKQIGLWFMHKSIRPTLRIAEKFVKVIFTGTKDSCRIKSKKIDVVGHGIKIEDFRRVEKQDDVFRILSIGRITPRKGVHTLLEAIAILNKENSLDRIKIDIAGGAVYESDEIYLQELKTFTRENGLDAKVNFIGSIPASERYEIFGKADILAHTSNTGSLDKVVLEAFASECLVVSCNDSSKDVLSIFGDKFIFKSGDARALAIKIIMIVEMSRKEREETGGKLKEIVSEEHSLEKLIKKMLKKYNGSAS